MELSDAAHSGRRVRTGLIPHSAIQSMTIVVFLAVSSSVSGHLEWLLLETDVEFSSKGEALPMACQESIQVNTGFLFFKFFF